MQLMIEKLFIMRQPHKKGLEQITNGFASQRGRFLITNAAQIGPRPALCLTVSSMMAEPLGTLSSAVSGVYTNYSNGNTVVILSKVVVRHVDKRTEKNYCGLSDNFRLRTSKVWKIVLRVHFASCVTDEVINISVC